MSSNSGTSYGSRGSRSAATAAAAADTAAPSPSVSRESHDYHTPLSASMASAARTSSASNATAAPSPPAALEDRRRCSSPSPSPAAVSGAPPTSSGRGRGGGGLPAASPSSSSSSSPSPSPMPAGGSEPPLPQQQQQQPSAVVLSPAFRSSTSSSSSSSSSSSMSPTASPPSAAATRPAHGNDVSTDISGYALPMSSAAGGTGEGGRRLSGGGGGGAGLHGTVQPLSPLSVAAGGPTPAAAPVPAAAMTAATVSPSPPATMSPSVSPTNASANPRRSLNAAFTISPRTESDVEASEEYHSDAPSVCLELDRHTPPVKQYCNLGSLEERRSFVTEGCVAAAKAMSTQRIIEHLLPAILTAFEADDYGESFDDCAPSIARALPQVIACVEHKTTANITYFMGLIMELCCSAEQVVVKEIIAALQLIIGMVGDDVVVDLFLPFVLTMRVSFWSAPRTVAASLLGHIAMRPAVLHAAGLGVTDMFNFYAECCSDAAAMVRASVATSLHDWVKVAAVHRLTLAEMPLPLLRTLATDDLSDTVRYLLIEEIEKLARLMGRKSTTKYLLSTYISAFVDPSWRVRFTAASHLGTMASLVLNADDLEIVLKTLAADEEPETRAAVARQMDAVVQYCSPATTSRCCTLLVEHFAEDENPVVRRSAARHCHAFVYGSDDVVHVMCAFLSRLMEDPAFVVQESAIQSLGDLVTSLAKSVQAAEQHVALSYSMNSTATSSSGGGGGGSSTAGMAYGGAAAAAANATGASSSASSISSASRRQTSSHVTPSPQQQPARVHSRSGRHRSPHRTARLLAMAANGNSSNSNGSGSPTNTSVGGSGGGGGVAESNLAFIRKRADAIACAFVDKLTVLSVSRNWRIRDAVVCVTQYFPLVLTTQQFQPLTGVIFNALHDPVSAVRTQAVRTLEKVAAAYGGAWAAETATELLHSDTLSPLRAVGYMWRVVMIQCLEVLLPVVSELDARDAQRQSLLGLTVALLEQYTIDRVPNVRIATAVALPRWFAWFDVPGKGGERAAYNDAIRLLQQDTDDDVLTASQHVPYNRHAAE